MKKVLVFLAFMATMVFVSAALALTPDEIIKLKNAGVSDETIQTMVEQDQKGVREVKDSNGDTGILYSTGSSSSMTRKRREEEKVKNAWRILEKMIVDTRE